MQVSEIEAILLEALPLSEVHVKGDGSHYQVIAVGDMFDEVPALFDAHCIRNGISGLLFRSCFIALDANSIPNGRTQFISA